MALYSSLHCAVMWNKTISYTFDVIYGVRQGVILSPYLFSIYIDDLITELRQFGHGTVYTGRISVGCIFYADDIVLLPGSCHGLQKMVDVCSGYGGRFDIRFNINTSKSQNNCFWWVLYTKFRIDINDLAIQLVEKDTLVFLRIVEVATLTYQQP